MDSHRHDRTRSRNIWAPWQRLDRRQGLEAGGAAILSWPGKCGPLVRGTQVLLEGTLSMIYHVLCVCVVIGGAGGEP